MKRPLLNLHQRQSIYLKTYMGACLELTLSVKHLLREIESTLRSIIKKSLDS